jgi:methylthioribose-1-phosphate isomerase
MSNGDVINKIGTYEKAVVAYENNIPFYVAIPCSTIDTSNRSALEVIIEQRNSREMTHASGILNNDYVNIQLYHQDSNTLNVAFDITPRKYITGIITEHGICDPNNENLYTLI